MKTISFSNPRLFCAFIILMLSLSACNFPDRATDATATIASDLNSPVPSETPVSATSGPSPSPFSVASATAPLPPTPTLTPQPSPTLTPEPTQTATEIANNVTGAICFPGESGQEMVIYFQREGTDEVTELQVAAGEDQYGAHLSSGEWIAYAWLTDFSRGGLYSEAVVCGGGDNCDDHDPQPFEVIEGQVTEGINICDWYAPLSVPYPPGVDQDELTGELSGRILYPGGNPPSLKVVAFNRTAGTWQYNIYKAGSTSYTLPNLAPGVYVVVAYTDDGEAGGHADANHVLIQVTVKPGQTSEGVDINDWNAPEGAFPPDPSE